MYNSIGRSQVFVLDQDEALDFDVNKLGLVVSSDLDLGFMRWLRSERSSTTPRADLRTDRGASQLVGRASARSALRG